MEAFNETGDVALMQQNLQMPEQENNHANGQTNNNLSTNGSTPNESNGNEVSEDVAKLMKEMTEEIGNPEVSKEEEIRIAAEKAKQEELEKKEEEKRETIENCNQAIEELDNITGGTKRKAEASSEDGTDDKKTKVAEEENVEQEPTIMDQKNMKRVLQRLSKNVSMYVQ